MSADFHAFFPQEPSYRNTPSRDEGRYETKTKSDLYALSDTTTWDVVTQEKALKGYLDVHSRLPSYSVPNTLLIFAQKSDASQIGEPDYWQEKGVAIRRNEQPFSILKPTEEYLQRQHGAREKYRVAPMYDISQTTMQSHQISYPDIVLSIKALLSDRSAWFTPTEHLRGKIALYDPASKEILVSKTDDFERMFQELSREVAHAKMDKGKGTYDRAGNEFTAACVSYVLCKRNGIDTGNLRLQRLIPPEYREMEPMDIRHDLEKIHYVSQQISDVMREGFGALNPQTIGKNQRERGRGER